MSTTCLSDKSHGGAPLTHAFTFPNYLVVTSSVRRRIDLFLKPFRRLTQLGNEPDPPATRYNLLTKNPRLRYNITKRTLPFDRFRASRRYPLIGKNLKAPCGSSALFPSRFCSLCKPQRILCSPSPTPSTLQNIPIDPLAC